MLIFWAVYLLGFASGVKKYFPYTASRIEGIGLYEIEKEINERYNIPELTTLPDNFSVIIGHAYGTHKNAKNDDFIAGKDFKFLVKKAHSLGMYIILD